MDPKISGSLNQVNHIQLNTVTLPEGLSNKTPIDIPVTINTTDTMQKSKRREFLDRMKPRNLWKKSFKSVDSEDWQDFSEKALLLKESTNVLTYSMHALPYISAFGAAGALGLTAVSVAGLTKSKNHTEMVDRAASASWGIQAGLQTSVKAFHLGKTATKIAAGLGVVGGVLETGLGIKRVIDGKKSGDKEKLKIGLLDIGTGVTWAISSAFIPPPFGSILFLGAALLKTGYINRKAVKKASGKIARKIKGWVKKKFKDPYKNIEPDVAKNPA